MSSSVRQQIVRYGLIVALALTLAGCGDSVEGTYHDPAGAITLILKDGMATLKMLGESHDYPYKVQKDKVILQNPKEGDMELTRNPDGTLSLGNMGTLKKS
jgi:hypothetical protein